MITFDGLEYDCQGAGEFIIAESLEDPTFVIQERFTRINSTTCNQMSVSTGVVIKDTNVPAIQISTPRIGQASPMNIVNTCPIDFYLGETSHTLGTDFSDSGATVALIGSQFPPLIRIVHLETFVTIEIRVQISDIFGCHFFVETFIPEDFRPSETILGLLGTCNADRNDDWRASNGVRILNKSNFHVIGFMSHQFSCYAPTDYS